MPPRLALVCALGLAACSTDSPATGDAHAADAADPLLDADTVDAPDAPDAGDLDAGVDAPPDGSPDDVTPPQLVAIAPAGGGEIWLHEPIRIELDEPIRVSQATVTARIGATAVAATITLDGERVASVTVAAAARGLGTLELDIVGITDASGNAADPIAAQFTLAPWQRSTLDAGAATTSPALAVTATGTTFVAWAAGAAGARRVVVRRAGGGAWLAVGGPLGGADVGAVALALAANGKPVVAWIESGTARAARWGTSAWIALPDLGAASAVALAASPSGAITAAAVGTSVTVSALVADAWQPVGATLATGGALAGPPALAAGADATAVVGWIASGQVRVHRYQGSAWSAMQPIATAGSRVGLAARGSVVAVAWDDQSPSWGVYAAKAAGSAWTQLGRALDVDVAGDASAPAIALDAANQPVVAWRERIETAERGVIARWSGTAWTIVGGHTWLAGTAAPTPPALALHAGQAPVVGYAAQNTIAIARHNGPKTPAAGVTRASIAGCAYDAAAPPVRLLQTGCFAIPSPGKPVAHVGLVPYDIVAELWSDGALKRRWIALPSGASMTTSSTGAWAAPVGAFVVKEFAIETMPGDPATRRAIETRVLVRAATGWKGFTYQWRSNGLDADLLNDGQFIVDWPLAGGGTHSHVYPSRSHCDSCHHSSYGPLLGLRPQQLARWFDYDGVIADQLPTLAGLDVGPAASATPFVAPHDATATVEQRMRGYMAANCAHCHNPANLAIKDLRYPTPLASTRLCESIVPGSPAQSRVYELVSSRPGMPALGSLEPDPLAVDLLGRWITGMTSCP